MIKVRMYSFISILVFIFFGIKLYPKKTITSSNYLPIDLIFYQPGIDDGKDVFMKYCLPCHQKDGSGVPNMYPPLKSSDWVNGDKKKIITVLLNGMDADIEVNGTEYSQTMPKFDYLTDQQIANVLTYVRHNFGNQADPVTVKEVSESRVKKSN